MKIYDKNGTELLDVLITQDAKHEQEMMKSDFVMLSWNSDSYTELPADAYIIPFPLNEGGDGLHYSLLEPYTPEQVSESEWKFEPQFNHPLMYLSKVTYKRPSEDTSGNDITYIDWPYTGSVSVMLNDVADIINTTFGLTGNDAFTVSLCEFTDKVISTQFTSQDILSALTNVANVCECEWHLSWKYKKLFFGRVAIDLSASEDDVPVLEVGVNVRPETVRNAREGFWNAFEPQGSTRNIMRKSASQEFVQSDVRLSLNRNDYPDGIIYTDGMGNPITKQQFLANGVRAFIKPLIFEEVYPRQDVYVYKVRYRESYLVDSETGEKVVAYTDDNGEAHYLKKAIWYFRLAVPVIGQDPDNPTWQDFGISENIYIPFSSVTFDDDGRTITLHLDIEYKEGMFVTKTGEHIAGHRSLGGNFGQSSQASAKAEYQRTVRDYTPERLYRQMTGSNPPYDVRGYSEFYEYSDDYDPDENEKIEEALSADIGNDPDSDPLSVSLEGSGELVMYMLLMDYVGDHQFPGEVPYTFTYSIEYERLNNYQYAISVKIGDYTLQGTYNTYGGTFVSAQLTSEVYTALKASMGSTGTLQLIDGYNSNYFEADNKVSQILDGTKPVIAFQPNTYRKTTTQGGETVTRLAESTPLAGLGEGDGKGNYGFVIRYLAIEVKADKSYINEANKAPTEEGDTGIVDWISGQRATVDEHDFEVEFEQNGTTILPSILAQGVIPKGDHTDNAHPSLFGNKANVYNIAVGSEFERAAQAELAQKTLDYIQDALKDKNGHTVESDPVVFEQDNPNLFIGQRVKFQAIGASELDTRVMKLVTKLDYDFEQEITVGNEVIKGNTQQLQEKVEALVNGGGTGTGEGGGVSIEMVKDIVRNMGNTYWLSKVADDIASGKITFNDKVTAQLLEAARLVFTDTLSSKDAIKGYLEGKGITMDAVTGLIQADGFEVRGFFRAMEAVINKLQLMTSDYSFTESAKVEHVSTNPTNGQLTLSIRKEHDNDVCALEVGDIVYGKVNDLLDHGTNYTTWMRITAKDATTNQLTAVLYDGQSVPGGVNFSPKGTQSNVLRDDGNCAWYDDGDYDTVLNITRHGNITNTARQQGWVLSTTDKRLSFMWNVDAPILEPYMYALCLGILPDLPNLPSTRDPNKPSLYVDTIFYDHSHQANFPAKVIKEDRGQWTAHPTSEYEGVTVSEPYHKESFTYVTWLTYRNNPMYSGMTDAQLRAKMLGEWMVDLETSRVWNNGILWECLTDGTSQQPSFGCTDWKVISGDTTFYLELASSNGDKFYRGHVNTVITPTLYFGQENISSKVYNWSWERSTESGKSAADQTWDLIDNHDSTRVLTITNSDMPAEWTRNNKAIFTCKAQIGEDDDAVQVSRELRW